MVVEQLLTRVRQPVRGSALLTASLSSRGRCVVLVFAARFSTGCRLPGRRFRGRFFNGRFFICGFLGHQKLTFDLLRAFFGFAVGVGMKPGG
ncbi:hypothetical protein Pan54_39390 [Rubinisphaera italica]|uniref:Uncharacterized protein n=1 Tax=Rubinisphaera italica TaxID=2527969 RepID=A0A5C5XJ23_9PLAN|nr:hypothetical protein Pan54_39390 [Rubinisphaera italica]